MKTSLNWALMGVLCLGGVGQGLAADAGKTNWVQNFNFTLTAWVQDQSKPVRVTNKDIITHLSGVWVTNRPTFPGGDPVVTQLPTFTTGKLITKQAFGDTNADVVVRVGSGKNTVDYSVGSAFAPPEDVARNAPVYYVSANGTTNTHALATFALWGDGLAFVLQGMTAMTDTKVNANGDRMPKTLTADVSGPSLIGSDFHVMCGKITLSGGHLE